MSLFVSYARADAEFALKLANDLRRAGVPIWVDQVDIAPGQPWDQSVEQALHGCTGILLVLSPRSVASRSVMDEVSYALDENKLVLPVLFEECDIPFRLRRLQRADLRRDYDAGLAAIIDALPKTAKAATTPTAADVPSRGERAAPAAPAADGNPPTRTHAAFIMGSGGAVFSVFALFLVYANDARIGTTASHGHGLLWSATVPALPAVIGWAIAGAIAPARRRSAAATALGAAIVFTAWIAIFGTYADVMMAAVVVGAPLGAIAGAIASRWMR